MNMPDAVVEFLFLWFVCVFILGLHNLFHFVWIKLTRYTILSAVLLVIEFFMLQIISDLLIRRRRMDNTNHDYILGRMNVLCLVALFAAIMVSSIFLTIFYRRWKKEHITPMSVKDSIDKLQAGLCYWEDGGRIILSNKKMDEICLAVSGEMLLNGEKFYECMESECIPLPDGTRKYFFHNQVEFEDKQIHELIAVDVTELYKKNELLELETNSLRKMNESLRNYNRNIEETIRKQEILDAKVYIHDEMNRLMLITTANADTPMPAEDFDEILTLWKNNAILLGLESGKERIHTDITEVTRLAEMLGIRLSWQGERPETLPASISEVLIIVAKEAIANAVKHAEAKEITIEIHKSCEDIMIDISNGGKLPAGTITPGGGLTNIKRMVKEKKGRFKVEVKDERFHLTLNWTNDRKNF